MITASFLEDKAYPSVKKQTLMIAAAVTAAVLFPQLFHLAGVMAGTGPLPGRTWLPMHIPVLAAGMLAGPLAGAVLGLLSPLVSFALSGMPDAARLPFMTSELAFLGLAAGLMYRVKLPVVLKVLAAQLLGKVIYFAGLILLADASFKTVVMTLKAGLPGLVLQLVSIPLVFMLMKKYADRRASQTFSG